MAKTKKRKNRAPENAGGTALADIDPELLRQRAYERYLARGGEHGHDLDDWLAVEQELRGRVDTTNPER
jgi:DUF2934 family protein